MVIKISSNQLFLFLFCGCCLILLINLRKFEKYQEAVNKIELQKFKRKDVLLAPVNPKIKSFSLTNTNTDILQEKPWFMAGGKLRPVPAKKTKSGQIIAELFPSKDRKSDRIVEQLMYIPPDYNEKTSPIKKILFFYGVTWFNVPEGSSVFHTSNCPVKKCTITANQEDAKNADAILFKDDFEMPPIQRPINQIWILYFLENPYYTDYNIAKHNNIFNWTSTYRRDSDIVAPYGKWVYYNDKIKQIPQETNYAANKTKKVAWFVSNCNEIKNGRLTYANDLKKHIQVDIYGSCGDFTCSQHEQKKCFNLLSREYKFYLSFENSNCQDYITEKLFLNALTNNIIPIVMGARPIDYERSAPYHSYIHVDEFESPKELADYLHKLDKNDHLYNSYFRWRGTGELINTFFMCRLCAMVHHPIPKIPRYYKNVNEWWRRRGTCNLGSWRKNKIKKYHVILKA